jgi:hypothetical protein
VITPVLPQIIKLPQKEEEQKAETMASKVTAAIQLLVSSSSDFE